MRFVHALDAIFELTAVVRKLLSHLIDAARHVATERTHVHFSPLSQHYRADSSLRRRLQRSGHCWLLSSLSLAVVWATHGRAMVIAAAALRGLGNSPRL
jgi:hypothetical protein